MDFGGKKKIRKNRKKKRNARWRQIRAVFRTCDKVTVCCAVEKERCGSSLEVLGRGRKMMEEKEKSTRLRDCIYTVPLCTCPKNHVVTSLADLGQGGFRLLNSSTSNRPGPPYVAAWDLGSVTLAASPQSPLLSRPIRGGVLEAIYSELVLFAKYSSVVYQFICLRPLGNKLAKSVRPLTKTPQPGSWLIRATVLTHAHGFVVRDDTRKESSSLFVGALSWRTCSQVCYRPPFNEIPQLSCCYRR